MNPQCNDLPKLINYAQTLDNFIEQHLSLVGDHSLINKFLSPGLFARFAALDQSALQPVMTAPQCLTGDAEAIESFINRFDVRPSFLKHLMHVFSAC